MIERSGSVVVVILAVVGCSAFVAAMGLWFRAVVKRPKHYVPYGVTIAGLVFLACLTGGITVGSLKQPGLRSPVVLVLGSLVFALLGFAGFAIPLATWTWAKRRLKELEEEEPAERQAKEDQNDLASAPPT